MVVFNLEGTCNKIFELAKEQGLSNAALARKIGVTQQAIAKWKSGICSPSIDNYVVLTDIFNVSLDEIIQKEELEYEVA